MEQRRWSGQLLDQQQPNSSMCIVTNSYSDIEDFSFNLRPNFVNPSGGYQGDPRSSSADITPVSSAFFGIHLGGLIMMNVNLSKYCCLFSVISIDHLMLKLKFICGGGVGFRRISTGGNKKSIRPFASNIHKFFR